MPTLSGFVWLLALVCTKDVPAWMWFSTKVNQFIYINHSNTILNKNTIVKSIKELWQFIINSIWNCGVDRKAKGK